MAFLLFYYLPSHSMHTWKNKEIFRTLRICLLLKNSENNKKKQKSQLFFNFLSKRCQMSAYQQHPSRSRRCTFYFFYDPSILDTTWGLNLKNISINSTKVYMYIFFSLCLVLEPGEFLKRKNCHSTNSNQARIAFFFF